MTIFWSCAEKPKYCHLNLKAVLTGNESKVHVNDSTVADIGIDSIIGGEYSFFQNGLLKSYSFLVQRADISQKIHPGATLVKSSADSSNVIWYSTYSEIYDSTGKLIKTYGHPLVYSDIHIMKDSVFIKMYFFTFNKEYEKIVLTDKNHRPYSITLQNAPMLSNMELVSLGHKSNGEKDFVAFVQAEYKDKCSLTEQKFFDTVSFDY